MEKDGTGFDGFIRPPHKNRKEVVEEIQEKWELFFEEFLSAVSLMGGSTNPDHWRRMTIEAIYKTLSPNGIALTFRLDPTKIDRKVFGWQKT